MKMSVRVTLSAEAAAKAKRQAAEAGWTTAAWIAWLVEDYIPPTDSREDDE